MTDRVKGFIVTLDKDYREDDVEIIKQTIGMIKGVLDVTDVKTDIDDHMNRQRVVIDIQDKIFKVLKDSHLG